MISHLNCNSGSSASNRFSWYDHFERGVSIVLIGGANRKRKKMPMSNIFDISTGVIRRIYV
jgi:hypothetical protein